MTCRILLLELLECVKTKQESFFFCKMTNICTYNTKSSNCKKNDTINSIQINTNFMEQIILVPQIQLIEYEYGTDN